MKRSKLFLLLITLIFTSAFSAAAQQLAQQYNLRQRSAFTENKGQIADQNGNVRRDVKYLYSAPGMKLALKNNSFSYEIFTLEKKKKQEDTFSEATGSATMEGRITSLFEGGRGMKEPEEITIHTHRIDVSFVGANSNPQIIAEEKSSDYNNYYFAHTPEEGVTSVYSYNKLTYKNLYQNIDIVFYAREEGKLKYDIVVHPGGKLEDVKMKYDGADGLDVKEGRLKLITTQGEIEEEIPYSYLKESKQHVIVNHTRKGDEINFNGSWPKNQTLIIDPLISWGTYYGGTGVDKGGVLDTDDSGNIYLTGSSYSTTDIATSGAYQTTNYWYNAFIVKFNSFGIRQWGTYYGGSGETYINSIKLVRSNIIISGSTSSSTGIATSGSFQSTYGGWSYDVYMVKFNTSGLRQWGTYYGGSGDDGGSKIITHQNGNIYLTFWTNSYLATTTGAHQSSKASCFIAKFNTNGVRQWATYFGGRSNSGSSFTSPIGICLDTGNNLFITGDTFDTSGISTLGSHQSALSPNNPYTNDAFLVKFDSNGVRLWGTYFGGSEEDYGSGVSIDSLGYIYLTGSTQSSTGIATSNAYQTAINGNADGFVAKFNNNGILQWSTYYGGNNDDGIGELEIDQNSNLFFAGITNSLTGLATKRVHQTTFGGNIDVFLAKFNSNGKLQWCTYYGGKDKDQPGGFCLDDSGNIYIAGATSSSSGIATPGAHKYLYNNGIYGDAFLAKFPDRYCNFYAEIKGDTIICPKALYSYTSFKDTGLSYKWEIKGGTIISGQNKDSINVIWNPNSTNIGSIKVVVSNSYCKDSITQPIKLLTLPDANTGLKGTICIGTTVPIGSSAVAGNSYSWTSKPAGFTSTSSNALVSPKVTTTYYLTEISGSTGCSNSDSVTISVNPPISNNTISAIQRICIGEPSPVITGSLPGGGGGSYFYNWESSTDSINWYKITAAKDSSYKPGMLSQTTYFRRIVSTPSCSGLFSSFSNIGVIEVNLPPKPSIKGNRFSCANTITKYNVKSDSGDTFFWSITNGKIISGQGTDTILVEWSPLSSGKVKVLQSNKFGCSDSTTILVTINPQPVADFNATEICFGNITSFTYTGSLVSAFNWSFGDGDSSLIAKPTHAYKAAGTYKVRLIVTSTSGCNDTINKDVIVNPLPTANFTSNKTCFGDSTWFTNSSSLAASSQWNFGDGITSLVNNPTHTYKAAGTYQVKLIVTSTSGCKDTITKDVIVDSLPVAGFSYKNTCFGDSTSFTNTSTSAATYLWSFGDGNTSVLENPSHQYKNTGTFTVKLKVRNGAGCTDSVSKTVTINPLPQASISVTKDTTAARSFSFSSNTNAAHYLWSFSDGITDSGKTVKHIYQKDSIYKITLAVRDTNGCVDFTDTTITVFTVGINELSVPAFNLKIYPNPFTNTSTVEYNLLGKAKTAISIYDLAGKEIAVLQKGTQQEGKHIIIIDADRYQLKAGIYILKILIGNQIISRQLVKLKV